MSESSQIIFQAPEIDQLAPFFPAYQIECLIATGGMGAVYKAVQKSLDRTVAIKILPREFSQDPVFCAGFEAEAKSMARLNHPNLIGVYDFGEVNGMLFIVMEFVSGQSLFHSTNGRAVESKEVIRLITAICEGLAHAHENGIIHRDIKPSNVLLDHQNNPKIGDFGLAHPVGTGHQEGAQIYGTPGYTAPEVVNAPQTVNHRADIFSIGVLLHELLTGKLPASDQRLASQIAGCDLRFDAIIKRATAEVPEMRYPNAHQIVADISQIQRPTATGPAQSAMPTARRGPTASSPAARAQSMPARSGTQPRRGPAIHQKSSGASFGKSLAILMIAAALGFLVYKRFTGQALVTHTIVANPKSELTDATKTSPTPRPEPIPPPKPEPSPAPKLRPTPGPKPAPRPVAPPAPRPTPAPRAEPAPEPSPEPKLEARFNVPDYLLRAKEVMRQKGKEGIDNYRNELGRNLESYQRAVERSIRSIADSNIEDNIKHYLKSFVDTCKKDAGRIPATIDPHFVGLKDAEQDLEKHLQKQSEIDLKMIDQLKTHRDYYTTELEKKQAALTKDRDDLAAAQIAEEIELVRESETHFMEIMECEIPVTRGAGE